MTFSSILSEGGDTYEGAQVPDFFVDLNLDQVVASVAARREEHALKPFFLAPLETVDAIRYRNEVVQDLEVAGLRAAVEDFCQRMRTMRQRLELAKRVANKYNRQGWFLNAVESYCEAVDSLIKGLEAAGPRSRGFSALLDFLKGYAERGEMASLRSETAKLRGDLSAVRYTILIKDGTLTVRRSEGEADYSADVERTFEKFKEGAVKDYKVRFSAWPETNAVETAALNFVAKLFPDVFRSLDEFCARRADYVDRTVSRFDREVQFYLAYLDEVAPLKAVGLRFCYPEISGESKEVESREGFDLALAIKLTREKTPIVTNDFLLKGDERIFVVNGPNQGGKTTFARTFGQLHYLMSLGLPVPGSRAKLFLYDRLFTHFEREENIDNFRSKLEDDLFRIHSILEQSTPRSIIVVNEEFSSSTVKDAVVLGRKVLERIEELDALCVYVTFLEELSRLKKTVSVLSTVSPENPEVRTYKILRRPADGAAYAAAIADRYRLSYDLVKERIKP